MECNNCGNKKAYGWRVVFSKEYGRTEECNVCTSSPISVYLPDVFWKGPGYQSTIQDKDGKPIYLWSRQHKARVMREQNLREAGDMHHGTRGTEFEKVNAVKAERDIRHKEDVKRAGRIFRDGMRKLKK